MQIHVFVWLAERGKIVHHLDGCDTRSFERLQQAITSVDELFDLLARQFAASSQFAEHPLAICTGLVDHVSALLLGHRQFGFGVSGCVLTPAGSLDLGLFAQALRLVGRVAQ